MATVLPTKTTRSTVTRKDAKEKHEKSVSARLKKLHRATMQHVSLKQFAVELMAKAHTDPSDKNVELQLLAQSWFHNKRAKVKKPHLKIGSTRKKKSGQK